MIGHLVLKGLLPRQYVLYKVEFITRRLRHPIRRMPTKSIFFLISCSWVSICTWLTTKKRFCFIYQLGGKSVKYIHVLNHQIVVQLFLFFLKRFFQFIHHILRFRPRFSESQSKIISYSEVCSEPILKGSLSYIKPQPRFRKRFLKDIFKSIFSISH